jgi:hypothetical protein
MHLTAQRARAAWPAVMVRRHDLSPAEHRTPDHGLGGCISDAAAS